MSIQERPPVILAVMCSNSGTCYWRMMTWWEAAYRTRKAGWHVLGWEKDCNGHAVWQDDIVSEAHRYRLLGMLYTAAVQADAIVFQRTETEAALSAMHALKDQFPNKPILTEIDDDLLNIANYSPAAEFFKPSEDRSSLLNLALRQFKSSDALIVSTPFLKELYADYCKHIYVVPNSIDLNLWDKAAKQRRKIGGLRIGWIGGGTHSEDLRLLDEIIDPICEDNKDVKFVICSYFGEDLQNLPDFLRNRKNVEIVNHWAPVLKYPVHLSRQDFDIGLAPLRDNEFNRAKSNLRWLEYSALGIPTVASQVGHFAETIKHGVDGFLAHDPAEMRKWLELLISDKKTRHAIGQAAYYRIMNDFNIERNLDLYISAVEDTLSRPAVSAPSTMTGVDGMCEVAEPQYDLTPLEVIHEPANLDEPCGQLCPGPAAIQICGPLHQHPQPSAAAVCPGLEVQL